MPYERPSETGPAKIDRAETDRATRSAFPFGVPPCREPGPPRYSDRGAIRQISPRQSPVQTANALAGLVFGAFVLAALGFVAIAAENPAPVRLVAFGDSLTAGYGLPQSATFPAVLERELRAEGFQVSVVNAGVSGDTTSGGLARLDWTLADGADGVILELGANDMLRGLDPTITKGALDAMLAGLKARNVKVLITGMKANPSLGKEYKARFDAIFPDLAAKYEAPLYPFFLDGVASEPGLNQPDGLHPNAAGVERIVKGILPSVTAFLKQFRQ